MNLRFETTFIDGGLDEVIYMQQPKGLVESTRDRMVCKLFKSIYISSKFLGAIQGYSFEPNPYKACIYKNDSGRSVVLLLYVNDILLIGIM